MTFPAKFMPHRAADLGDRPMTLPKLGSVKLDGIRGVTGEKDLRSKSMKKLPNLHVNKLLEPYSWLDGELTSGDSADELCYKRTFSAVMTIAGEPEFVFNVFDDISDLSLTYEQRYDRLCSRKGLPSFIQVLPQTLITNQEDADLFYEGLLERGYEGACWRNPKALYHFGKAGVVGQDLVKKKPFKDADAVILGVYEAMHNANEAFTNELGRTARSTHQANKVGKGTLGGFVVRDVVTGKEFHCAPGKATHKQREEWWANPPIGQIIKYRYMSYGVDDKPRQNRFLEFRHPSDTTHD